jgi:hypothetical protein
LVEIGFFMDYDSITESDVDIGLILPYLMDQKLPQCMIYQASRIAWAAIDLQRAKLGSQALG